MVRDNYLRVKAAVAEAALRAGRDPARVRLMAVTKTVEEGRILEAIGAGADLFGENRVQELERKRGSLPLEGRELHLIGHLQTNKAAKAAACADMIQSVDSFRLASELSRVCVKMGKTQDILLEVNIGNEPAKFGFSPEQMDEELSKIAVLPGLRVRGLMTIPPFLENLSETAEFFSRMRKLFIDIRGKKMDNITMESFDCLSMGMSGDFEAAIAEGSTLVRVGSAIFGNRAYH
ncbi:MAG: YggS family pyridoxal phosphate-dependent enzyme [Oscillospiraceae bacterium]|nr:YggS family pyridoxal phosphate-dependent enzyme [Oscillospiraceae bacterium]